MRYTNNSVYYQQQQPPIPVHLRVQQILAVYDASCALGIFMYSKYARLFHRPKVLTVESSRPLAAAVVAAPMRKLCQSIDLAQRLLLPVQP